MTDMRRVHKKLRIKLNRQNSTPTTSTSTVAELMLKTTILPNRAWVVVECTAFILAIVLPVSVHAGVLEGILNATSADGGTTTDEMVLTSSPLDIPVLAAAQNPDPQSIGGGDDVIAEDGVLVSTGPVGKDEIKASHNTNSGEITLYTVREGDSLSEIAEMFDVTANTILWANDLARAASIQPGDNLVILPVIGVRHVVKSGDTIASIAKKYDGNADEIMTYNQLASASDLSVGDTVVVPGGELQATTVSNNTTAAKPTKSSASTASVAAGANSGSLVNPAPGTVKTQSIHGYNGVDLGGPIGTTVRAAAGGEVIVAKSSGWNGGYGNYIVIKHPNGTQTLYGHLSRVDVVVGEKVAQAETIGAVGNTGKSTGSHLHFEVRGGKNPF